MATRLKNATVALASPLPTAIDTTVSSTEAAAAAATPSTSLVIAAAAASSLPAAAAVSTFGLAATASPPGPAQQRRQQPPPSAVTSDESMSVGCGFDGFDSDIISQFARYVGCYSSELSILAGSNSQECV